MNEKNRPTVAHTLIRMAILAAVGAVVGLAVNALRADGLPIPGDKTWHFDNAIRITGHDPATECVGVACEETDRVAPQQIDLKGAKALFDEGDVRFVDARSAGDFAAGHIRGAVSLPEDDFDARAERVLAELPPDGPIVTYCSGEECMASVYLADKLADAGYTDVHVFFGGWPEWVGAGYPVGRNESTWSGGGS